MRLFATLLIAGLLTACSSAEAPTPTKDSEKKIAKEDLRPEPSSGPPSIEAPVAPATHSTEASASELPTPAWFDSAKIDHAKVLQPKNQAKVGTNLATAMLLELDPGTTPRDCIASISSEMAKTLGEVAEAVPGEKDRMTLQGKTDSYSYTVVCGPGKDGQTTLYLSYTDL